MTAKKNPQVYLHDIAQAVKQIEEYTAMGKADFFARALVQDGVIRQISIIGEAAAKLPKALRTTRPEIPWGQMIGMRNILIHDYSETNLETLWKTVEKDLPILKQTVQAMMRQQAA